MAGLVDYAALVLDLRGELQQRASWGRGQILGLIVDLEQQHRIDESADAAVLRRYTAHLTDCFMGTLPAVTPDPLNSDDRETPPVMDLGHAIRSPTQEDACRIPTPSRLPPGPLAHQALR